jgi:lysophospholipase L1-like esterase
MPQITSGSNATFTVPSGYVIDVQCPGGWVQLEYPVGTKVFEGNPAGQTFGPYSGGSAKLTSVKGDIYYEVDPKTGGVDTPFDPSSVAITGGTIATGLVTRPATIVLFGDSRVANCDYNVDPNSYSTNLSWWDWGASQVPGGPPLDVVYNAGVGGNTTAQMQARLATDVLAYLPGYATLWGGTNDGWLSASDVDASYARMVSMIETMKAKGIYVFVISETTSNTKGTTFPVLVAYYNDRLRQYCAQTAGCEFWDFNRLVMDPTSANGYNKATMLYDGVHLGPLGASTCGKNEVAARLARFPPNLCSIVNTQVDTQGVNASSKNIFSNPLGLGSGGTVGSGNTGTLPTSWSGQAAGAVSAAYSTPSRADGFGNDIQAVYTATASGTHFTTQTGTFSRIVPGQRYVVEAALKIASAVNVTGVSLTVSMFQGGTLYRRGWGYNVQTSANGDSLVDFDGIIRSRIFTAPAGTYTALTADLRVLFGGAGSMTANLGRFSMKAVS